MAGKYFEIKTYNNISPVACRLTGNDQFQHESVHRARNLDKQMQARQHNQRGCRTPEADHAQVTGMFRQSEQDTRNYSSRCHQT